MKRPRVNFSKNRDGEVSVWKGLVAGVAGGVLASFVMEEFQAAWNKASQALSSDEKKKRENPDSEMTDEPATVKVAQAISRKVTGHDIPNERQETAAELVHYGVGTTFAAVYGMLAEVAPTVTVGNGLGFGAGLWVLGDEIAVPAAGLSPWWKGVPWSTHVYALASHLVYGGVAEIVRRAVRRVL